MTNHNGGRNTAGNFLRSEKGYQRKAKPVYVNQATGIGSAMPSGPGFNTLIPPNSQKLDWQAQLQSVPINPMMALRQKQALDNVTYASIGIKNFGQPDFKKQQSSTRNQGMAWNSSD